MDWQGPDPGPRNAQSARGGVVLVSLYSWTCITIGVTLARFVVACIHKVEFDFDDGMLLAGSIFYTAATVCWQYAVNGGLGKHFSDINGDDATQYFKAAYAAQLLQLVAIAFAKLSSVFLLGRVAQQSWREKAILFGSVMLWTVYSLFAFAFQCGLPKPWETGRRKCASGGPLISIIVLNMASDILLTAWIFPILHPLNIDKARRRMVMVLFGSRAVVPIVAIAQVWAAKKAMDSDDFTWDTFELALLNQVVTSLSLIIASLPRIKRFLGGNGVNDPRIHDIELPASTRVPSDGGGSLKLVPSSSARFTTTVESGSSKQTEKSKTQSDWQKFVAMGSKQDDHASTSSLVEHGGVMLQQEVTVRVEDSSHPL